MCGMCVIVRPPESLRRRVPPGAAAGLPEQPGRGEDGLPEAFAVAQAASRCQVRHGMELISLVFQLCACSAAPHYLPLRSCL